MKTCNKCRETKPPTCFNRAKKTPDGLNYTCRDCQHEYAKKYYYENKEKIKVYRRRYDDTHREQKRERCKREWRKNREISEAYQRSNVMGVSFSEYRRDYLANEKMQ